MLACQVHGGACECTSICGKLCGVWLVTMSRDSTGHAVIRAITTLANALGMETLAEGVEEVVQFEVLEHRLKTEYNAEIRRQQLPYRFVRWITKSPKAIEDLKLSSTSSLAKDARDRDVILFENEWSIRWALENNEGLELAETASRLG